MIATLFFISHLSVAQGCGCPLSAANQWVLGHPSHFEPEVSTYSSPEDRPGDPLPFPVAVLSQHLNKELRRRGIPIGGEVSPGAESRTLFLSVHVWKDGGKYSYWLTLWPGSLPDDPKDLIYDDIWPRGIGEQKTSKLRQTLMTEISQMVEQFARLYAEWRALPK